MTVYEQLVDTWVEISELHIPADDPYAIQVCHDLRCECEYVRLIEDGRL